MAETVPNTGTIQVRDPWMAPPNTQPQLQEASFENASNLFLKLVNPGDAPDSLMAVQTDAAQTVGLYIRQPAEQFTAVPEISLPANSQLTITQGLGYHLILQDFTRELQVGDTISVTMLFGRSEPVTVQAEVREPQPVQGQGQGQATPPDPALPGQYEIRVTVTPQS
jgi:copper(I)-binding protein